MIKKLFCFLLLATALYGQDIFQQVYTPYVSFRNIPWGSGAGAMNNTFWFNSLAPEDGVCVSIYNNNPTNSHSLTLVVSQTSDATAQGFTGFSGLWIAVNGTTAFPITVNASSVTSIFYATRSSAYMALTFSGTAVQAGNPDTANIIAVQANSFNCANSGSLINVLGAFQTGTIVPATAQLPVFIGGFDVTSQNTLRKLIVAPGGEIALSQNNNQFGQGGGFISHGTGGDNMMMGANSTSTQWNYQGINNYNFGAFGKQGWIPGFVVTNILEKGTDQWSISNSATLSFAAFASVTNPAANS